MTKEEIIALIDSAIAGQGSAVDVGGALPKILKGILGQIMPTGQKYIVDDFDIIPTEIVEKLVTGDIVVAGQGRGPYGYVRYADGDTTEIAVIDGSGLDDYSYYEGEFDTSTHFDWNVQADWDEANSEAPAFIRNKPTIPQGALIMDATIDVEQQKFYVSDVSEISNAMAAGRMVILKINRGDSFAYCPVVCGTTGPLSKAVWIDGNIYSIAD